MTRQVLAKAFLPLLPETDKTYVVSFAEAKVSLGLCIIYIQYHALISFSFSFVLTSFPTGQRNRYDAHSALDSDHAKTSQRRRQRHQRASRRAAAKATSSLFVRSNKPRPSRLSRLLHVAGAAGAIRFVKPSFADPWDNV